MAASKQPKTEKSCKICSEIFLSNNKKQVYCSGKCNAVYQRSLDPDKHRKLSAARMRSRSPEQKKSDSINKRKGRLLREYGISQEQYDILVHKQNNLCYLCGNPETQIHPQSKKLRALNIDHDHVTGKIRSLLCNNCNRGLGLFSDDPKLLLAASEYINKWREK